MAPDVWGWRVAGGGAAAIVEEAGRHAGRLKGGTPRRAPAADGDAVAVEDRRAIGITARQRRDQLLVATVNFPFVATENCTPLWLAGGALRSRYGATGGTLSLPTRDHTVWARMQALGRPRATPATVAGGAPVYWSREPFLGPQPGEAG